MEQRLLAIINEMFEESNRSTFNKLESSMHLRNDLQLDSLMLAELTVRIEAEFGIDIFEERIVATIGEVLSELDRRS